MRTRDRLPNAAHAALAVLLVVLFVSTPSAGATQRAVDSGWNFADPAASERNFREMVEAGASRGDLLYQVEAISQLGRSIGLQTRFDEALEILDDGVRLLEPSDTGARLSAAEITFLQTRLTLERGRVLNSSGKPEASIPLFEEALELALSGDLEYLAVDAAHMLGIVEEPEAAIVWNERAMEMAEQAEAEEVKRWLGPLYNNLAWTYNDLGRHEDALALFEKDIDHRQSRGEVFEASIALWSKAKTLRYLGRVEEALEIQLDLAGHPLRKDKPAEGYTHEEIGECLLLLGRNEEAIPHFALAHQRLGGDPWLQANEAGRLARIERLGRGE